jgi:hypothetical protein
MKTRRGGAASIESTDSPSSKGRRSRSRKRAPEAEIEEQQEQQQPQNQPQQNQFALVALNGNHEDQRNNYNERDNSGTYLRAWKVWLLASLIWTVSLLAICWGLSVFGRESYNVGGKLLSQQWALVVSFWGSLRSGEMKYSCSIGGSLIHMLECEVASFANRVILFLVTQTYEFLQIVNKSTNILHILTLVNGLVSAIRSLFGNSLPMLSRAGAFVWWSAVDWHALLMQKVDEWPGI